MKMHVAAFLLAGAAALHSPARGADFILKSRAICPGSTGSVPISAVNIGGSGRLIAFDMALSFGGDGFSVPDTLYPLMIYGFDPTGDILVSGRPYATPPLYDIYLGVVKGEGAFDTARNPDGTPAGCIGLLSVAAFSNVPRGTVVDFEPVDSYGTPAGARPGATAATPDPEPVRILDFMPIESPTSIGGGRSWRRLRRMSPEIPVPLHMVAAGAPGDVNANGRIDIGDAMVLAAALGGRRQLSAYQRIAADVAPLNGYVPGSNSFGSGANLNGGSYGDGEVTPADLNLLVARIFHRRGSENFPQCEP
jgi:hypothetical protein